MFYNHILLEAYCAKDKCVYGNKRISIDCFAKKCENLSLSEAPNEISVVDENGVSIYDIGFGGDMETTETERTDNIKRWEKICVQKINEAYELYMKGND